MISTLLIWLSRNTMYEPVGSVKACCAAIVELWQAYAATAPNAAWFGRTSSRSTCITVLDAHDQHGVDFHTVVPLT